MEFFDESAAGEYSELILITSSHGEFLIRESGQVVGYRLEDSWDSPIPAWFDVVEYRRTYGQVDGHIDILDIGYVMPDGYYEPPEPDFRATIRQELA